VADVTPVLVLRVRTGTQRVRPNLGAASWATPGH
jgi:hypothetical protein